MDMYCDFNTATPLKNGHYKPLEEKEQLKDQLLLNIRSCLLYLLPNGTFCRNEFQVGDVWGNRGKSLRVELSGSKTGLWNDFATGNSGDIIDLWAVIHGKNARTEFSEVMASIGEWLGKKHTRERRSIKDLEQYMTCSWNYYDENNQVIVIVYRYGPPERKKEYRPFDVKKLSFGEPDIRPLYNIMLKTNMRGKCPEISEKFENISRQLSTIKNLKLIIFDPLISFVHADINSDPELGWFSTGLLASLATETGASVITAHHMRKPKISTVEQAREAIRGTTALVDGVRCSFALWPASTEHQNSVFNDLKIAKVNNAIYQGAIVKSNGLADRSTRTYLRSPIGLLEDVSEEFKLGKLSDEYLKKILMQAIAVSAEEGHPFTHTGGPGVFQQRHRLPSAFHGVSRHRLERLAQELLNERKIVKGMATNSKEDKWLDVPNGPIARGEGKFKLGAGIFNFK